MPTGIGIGISPFLGHSKSKSWTPDTLLGGETPSFWYKPGTRSGLTLPNAMNPGTNDASLLLPHLNTFLATNGYAYIEDNGSLDIINNLGTNPLADIPTDTGFTLCGTLNSESASKAAYKGLLGKWIAGGRNGRYGVYANVTTGYLVCSLQSSGGTVAITSTIDFTAQTYPFVLMDVNYTTKKLRFFVKLAGGNLTQIGTDTAFTGTLAQLGNAYRFYLGAENTDVTGAPTLITKTSFVDIKIFNKILTPTQQTQESTTHDVTGAICHWACNDIYLADSGTAGKHLTGVALDRTNIQYDIYGSKHLLNIGYSKFVNYPNREVHIGYKDDGTVNNYTPSGYTSSSDNAGSATDHNGADSYLIPTVGTVDRSDTTKVKDLASLTTFQYYYNLAYKNGLCSVESTNYRVRNYYKSITHFFKRTGQTITDWLIYPTGKTGNDYTKAITWTGENINPVFGSGSYLSMGMDSVYSALATHLHLGKAATATGEFMPIASASVTGAPTNSIGNPKILALNVNKCNGTTPVAAGEINWIMTYETTTADPMYVAKSHNGADWEFIMQLPVGGGLGQCDFYIDNNDPSDYHNIHVLSFVPGTGDIYEIHPLNASFTSWSSWTLIFATGIVQTYNATIILIAGVYHMFYSTYISTHHYMYHATCTHDPFSASNDWTNIDTGDWSGLGDIESFSIIHLGGTNWILYYLELHTPSSTSIYKYSLSTDNCATWAAGVEISSLSSPLQFSVGVIKLS